jgi:hypothetical protein
MSSLTIKEKAKLESLLHMSGGYVADFSDSTFGHFLPKRSESTFTRISTV